MAATYVQYNASTPIGGEVAQGIDLFRRGYALIKRAHEAANAATDAGSDTTVLVSGDFGALDATNAARYWTQLNAVVTIIEGDTGAGLPGSLASLDKGISG